MGIQAIREDLVDQVEGVPAPRGYKAIYYCDLDALCELVPAPLGEDLRSAAAAHLAQSRTARVMGAFRFRFWPAPSQAAELKRALDALRGEV